MSLLKALNVPDVVEQLANRGRGHDRLLAHISPREAAILKHLGGSGAVNPHTGLLEFDDSGLGEVPMTLEQPTISTPAAPTFTENTSGGYDTGYAGDAPTPAPITSSQNFAPTSFSGPNRAPNYDFSTPVGQSAPTVTPAAPLAVGAPVAAPNNNQSNTSTQSQDSFSKRDIASLLGTGALAGYNIIRGNKVADAQQRQIGKLADPYKTQAQQYLTAAQTGNLLPAQQQQLQALRAQAQQNLFNNGQGSGIAAQQAEQGVQREAEVFRQNLMQEGLQLSGVADQLTLQAIQAGYQADQNAQNAANNFFMAMAQTLGSNPQTAKKVGL